MSSAILEEVLEKGEERGGNIEFKKELDTRQHLNNEKRESLVAQLRHRVLSGDGEALYAIGVEDNGDAVGVSRDAFDETVEVLSIIADEADAEVSEVEEFSVEGEDAIVGLVTVTSKNDIHVEESHIVVGTAGHVDHGKSTLVGSLVTGSPDDGAGGTRSFLDVKPHEVERGLSADLSYAVYGFDEGEPMRMESPNRKDERSQIVADADRLVSFVDTVGHQPWLRTTIRGLVGQRLDYGLLVVAADDGPTKTTREHLGVLMAAELPTIIAITKTDLVSDDRVLEVEREVEQLVREANLTPLSIDRHGVDAAVDEISDSVIPIVTTSAVEMDGMDTMDELFQQLPKQHREDMTGDFSMYIDRTYTVEGVGLVATGTIKSGTVEVGDDLYLGPTSSGDFIKTRVQSMEIHYHQVDKAKAGQLVSLSLQNVTEDDVKRGMVLTSHAQGEPQTAKRFEAEVMVLNHPTSITDGYEPVAHIETISQTVSLSPDEDRLLPGDSGKAVLEFKFQPEVIKEGQRFVFREGDAKGIGTVTKILD